MIKIIAFIISTIFSISNAQPTYHKNFLSFVNEYDKNYINDKEFTNRFDIYQSTMEIISEHNKKNYSWKMKKTHFSDLTDEEFLQYVSGNFKLPISSTPNSLYNINTKNNFEIDIENNAYPMSLTAPIANGKDWTALGAVTSVKNQNNCGACYSFAATGGIEGIYKITYNKLVSLSEQQILDCMPGNCDCGGSLATNVYQYVTDNNGLCYESDYPYLGELDNCNTNYCTKYVGIGDYASLSNSVIPCSPTITPSDIIDRLDIQPLSIRITATAEFKNYGGGLFTGNSAGQCGGNEYTNGHAVLLTGYGTCEYDDGICQDAQVGQNPPVQYWKIKNSWGISWGMGGYIYIQNLPQNPNFNNGCGLCYVQYGISYPEDPIPIPEPNL